MSKQLAKKVVLKDFLEKKKILDEFKYLPDPLLNRKIAERKAKNIVKQLQRTVTGFRSFIPITCNGPECPYKNICELQKGSVAPLGEQCPLELEFFIRMYKQYIDKLNVDETDPVERERVIELAELEVINQRTSKYLADNSVVPDVFVAVNPKTGERVKKPEVSPAIEVKETISRRKDKILEELLATRKSKVKYSQKDAVDPAKYFQEIQESFKEDK